MRKYLLHAKLFLASKTYKSGDFKQLQCYRRGVFMTMNRAVTKAREGGRRKHQDVVLMSWRKGQEEK